MRFGPISLLFCLPIIHSGCKNDEKSEEGGESVGGGFTHYHKREDDIVDPPVPAPMPRPGPPFNPIINPPYDYVKPPYVDNYVKPEPVPLPYIDRDDDGDDTTNGIIDFENMTEAQIKEQLRIMERIKARQEGRELPNDDDDAPELSEEELRLQKEAMENLNKWKFPSYGKRIIRKNLDKDDEDQPSVDATGSPMCISVPLREKERNALPPLDRVKPVNAKFENDYNYHLGKRDNYLYNDSVTWTHSIGKALQSQRTSSTDLWVSLGGPGMLKSLEKDDEFNVDKLTAILYLASSLAMLPTKQGSAPFNFDDPVIQSVCHKLVDPKVISVFEKSLKQRLFNRLERWTGVYIFEYEKRGFYGDSTPSSRHPLANVPTVCAMNEFALKPVILNHRIGLDIAKKVSFEATGFSFQLDDANFDIRLMLDLIGESLVSELLYGVRRILYENQPPEGPGVIRDWFVKLVQKIFDKNSGFFMLPDEKGTQIVYRINPSNGNNLAYKKYFQNIGRVFAMSLIDGLPLGIEMNYGVYQLLVSGLSHVWTESDLLNDDLAAHNSWKKTMEMADVSGAMVTFPGSAEEEEIPLTNENRDQWSEYYIREFLFDRHSMAYRAIHDGFYELLSPGLSGGLLHAADLRDILRGDTNVSTEALMSSMEFLGYDADSKQIQWLREFLEEGGATVRAQFLFFVTALIALPFGFGDGLRITIRRTDLIRTPPDARTCSYTMNYPEYPTEKIAKEQLLLAILSTDMSKA